MLGFQIVLCFRRRPHRQGFAMMCQPSHPDQADADGRTQANRVSEWDLKIVVPGLIVLFVSCYVTERRHFCDVKQPSCHPVVLW